MHVVAAAEPVPEVGRQRVTVKHVEWRCSENGGGKQSSNQPGNPRLGRTATSDGNVGRGVVSKTNAAGDVRLFGLP